MTIRDSILSDIRKNQPSARDLPSVPFFHSTTPVDLKEKFCASLKGMAGDTITQYPDDLAQFIVARFPGAKKICSAVPEFSRTCSPADFSNWADTAAIDCHRGEIAARSGRRARSCSRKKNLLSTPLA